MQEIGFYHLLATPLEQAAYKLLERIISARHRVVVICRNQIRVNQINRALWQHSREGFLPHGSAEDGLAEHQPIWLTDFDENPNTATVLMLLDGSESSSIISYQRVVILFNGNDEAELSHARSQWQQYKASGLPVVYYRQQENGGWQKQAISQA